jgi:hypothetical protein
MNWTPDAVNHLRSLLDAGLSTSQAAVHFPGCTRNSIVGVAHRKGLVLAGAEKVEWTDERLAELREMARNGSDHAACARFFNVTQGAIRGVAKRYNIFIISAVPEKRRGKYGGITFGINHRKAPQLSFKFKEKPSPAPFLALNIADLEPGHCRWPEGDGHITYCGQPQREESSYCAFHHRMAHRRTDVPSEGFVRFLCAAE